MHMTMNDTDLKQVFQLPALIAAAEALGADKVERLDTTQERYAWMSTVLIRMRYRFLGKKDRGIVRQYLELYSGYTTSHIDHLIADYKAVGKLIQRKRTQPQYERVYTTKDIALLAEVADAFEHQNGKALKEVCREMYTVYGDVQFEQLAHISVSHLYALKKTTVYTNAVLTYTKTKPTPVHIGERKKPYPEGKPGFLRVDSVHQGDLDKEKGVYYVHLICEVTQWDITVCVAGISEEFMESALAEAFEQFPFGILNFHSDNGSEYINSVVAKLLETLRIHQTKSRARQSGDNALVEGKNAVTIRAHMGRMHIPKKHAEAVNVFYEEYFNPFANFHRFCLYPTEVLGAKGKIQKVYNETRTPLQKLLSLPEFEQYLKVGVTREILEEKVGEKTHLKAAQEMQKAKKKLFTSFRK
jgi:hypothetical protein